MLAQQAAWIEETSVRAKLVISYWLLVISCKKNCCGVSFILQDQKTQSGVEFRPEKRVF
jgi:hypothetical protein